MLTAQLIIARAVHIGASILLAGIFTFDLVILAPARRVGSGDSCEIEHRLFRLAAWSIVAALLSALLWFWLEVANMSGLPLKVLSRRQRGGPFCLRRNSVECGSFVSA